jgi:hypothetical protein
MLLVWRFLYVFKSAKTSPSANEKQGHGDGKCGSGGVGVGIPPDAIILQH